jgi:hypothetical protein
MMRGTLLSDLPADLEVRIKTLVTQRVLSARHGSVEMAR